jgi:predicted Zn-dependent protease
VAARDAISNGHNELASKRLVYARNADPRNPEILALLADQYRELGRLREAGRTVRDWIRADPQNPDAYRLAERIYEDMGAHDLAADVAAAGRRARRRLVA